MQWCYCTDIEFPDAFDTSTKWNPLVPPPGFDPQPRRREIPEQQTAALPTGLAGQMEAYVS